MVDKVWTCGSLELIFRNIHLHVLVEVKAHIVVDHGVFEGIQARLKVIYDDFLVLDLLAHRFPIILQLTLLKKQLLHL